MIKKIVYSLIGLAVLCLIAYGLFHTKTNVLGGANQCASGQTCLPSMEFTGANSGVTNTLQIDSGTFQLGSGSSFSLIKSGTCSILANASVTASTTSNFDCAFTGVQSGDNVQAQLSASSTLASQFVIKGVTASTTSGWITFSLLNLTGTSAVPAATNGFGSSTAVVIFR